MKLKYFIFGYLVGATVTAVNTVIMQHINQQDAQRRFNRLFDKEFTS